MEQGVNMNSTIRDGSFRNAFWMSASLLVVTLGTVGGAPVALAQGGLYKCSDGHSTTYSSTECEKLGLKSAGEIRDRLTVVGVERPAAKQAAPVKPAATEQAEEERTRKTAGAIKPVNPLVDRLLK